MRALARSAIVVLLALALAACQTLGNWFSSDDDEQEPAELVALDEDIPVDRVWSTDTGEGIDRSRPALSPVHDDGLIWTADHEGRVTAVDLESGRIQREFDVGLPLSAGPTVTRERVLLGTFDGELVVVDKADGRVLWRAALSSEILARPVLHDGVIVVRCIDGRVFGIDPADGSRIWVHDESVPLLTLRGNSPPLTRAGQVYIGYDDGQVIALRVADGSVQWEQQVTSPEGRTELERLADIDGPMMVVGTELYVVSYHGRLAGLALESGRVLWVKEVESASGLSLRRTLLASTDRRDTIWVIDRRNGATEWREERLARRGVSRPVFFGSLLVVTDALGYLHLFDADSGEMVGRAEIGGDPPVGAPLVVGDRLIVMEEDGTLSAWRVGSR